ncbi:MAG TPA: hypothetical protein VJI68_00140 [Candidatus Nanoarchaeia archaeon]|nr:hypothetical protein [Candidatus Nanoarchaeia archaeon]
MARNFNFDELCDFLKKQANIIRGQAFDKSQIIAITNELYYLLKLAFSHQDQSAILNRTQLSEAIFEFNLALEISFSNYRKQNKNLWKAIFGWGVSKVPKLKIPDIVKKV